ncbi:MAG: M50 family metallopeptidase [Hellea sp.]
MAPRTALILRIVVITAAYFGLSTYGGLMGWRILYPIRLFVTFLHEFGHASGALITGGAVEHIEIHPNAGGLTSTFNGKPSVILMGGYIGSAIFGNLLFYIGARKEKWVKPTLVIVIAAMLITGFIWYNTLFTTAVLCGFSALLFFVGFKTKFGREILMLLGLASVIYIIQDFNVGPSSDLAAMEREMKFIPAKVWMYIWLGIVLALLALNLKMLFSVKVVKAVPAQGKPKGVKTAKRFNPYKKD